MILSITSSGCSWNSVIEASKVDRFSLVYCPSVSVLPIYNIFLLVPSLSGQMAKFKKTCAEFSVLLVSCLPFAQLFTKRSLDFELSPVARGRGIESLLFT